MYNCDACNNVNVFINYFAAFGSKVFANFFAEIFRIFQIEKHTKNF